VDERPATTFAKVFDGVNIAHQVTGKRPQENVFSAGSTLPIDFAVGRARLHPLCEAPSSLQSQGWCEFRGVVVPTASSSILSPQRSAMQTRRRRSTPRGMSMLHSSVRALQCLPLLAPSRPQVFFLNQIEPGE